jgi:hypothetical protein
MVTPELEAAVAELARRLRDDLAAGPPDDVRERVIERYVYAVVNEHLQAMLAARPLPPEDESPRRLEAALAHAAQAAGLPLEVVERYREAAQKHWRANEDLARGLRAMAAFYEPLAALNKHLKHLLMAWTLPPFWGLPIGASKAQPETPPPAGPTAPELPAKPAADAKPAEQGPPVAPQTPAAEGPGTREAEVKRRKALLKEYLAKTGVRTSRVWRCAGQANTHSCHKPQFYAWLKGELPAESAPAQSLERFLRRGEAPPE